ncbi:ECF subfamily RNA polymerase sigma factor, BldN family [Streptomyces sp. NPDC050523]|uniref:ECF subfamily RNA polymerase sigma factor, BldN family n=1 Tax=Streptomyces sp. NPDC050523 TaxID=3365622 RepID=UPI0037ABBFA0
MSVEERLEQTRQALAEMWSDEAATAERLQRLLAHTASEPDAHAATPTVAAQQAAAMAVDRETEEDELALCPTCTTRATARAGRPHPIALADIRIARPAADSDSARMMDLVERAQAGEADAFGRLYDQYSDTVYRYIYYRVGGKATAEDLTSETFLRALRRIGTFTWQGRDFGAWLVTIARNLVADHFKSSRFRLEVTIGEMLDAGEAERSPEDLVVESLSNAALLEAVRRLNPQQQECVTLRFLQGLSVAETARVMGKNEDAIKTLQYRAVRALARLLPDDAH